MEPVSASGITVDDMFRCSWPLTFLAWGSSLFMVTHARSSWLQDASGLGLVVPHVNPNSFFTDPGCGARRSPVRRGQSCGGPLRRRYSALALERTVGTERG